MSRSGRFLLLLLLYAGCALISMLLAWELRFGFYDIDGIPDRYRSLRFEQLLYIVPFKCLCLLVFGQFRSLIQFFRMPDAVRLFLASSVATALLLVVWVFTGMKYVPPGSILLSDFVLFTFLVFGARVAIRLADEKRRGLRARGEVPEKIAVVGAGQAGSAVVGDMLSQAGSRMRPVMFFDDNTAKHGRLLHGVPIVGTPELIPSFHKTGDIDKVVVAIPGAETPRFRKIVDLLGYHRIPTLVVPSVRDLGGQRSRLMLARELRLEDLLYRHPVEIDRLQMQAALAGKRVLVTGAGGSIGGELARQIANIGPSLLQMVDRSEGALFLVEKLLRERHPNLPMVAWVADLRDQSSVQDMMAGGAPDFIFHAAAHKHVGMMERQPVEALLNNTLTTLTMARAAAKAGVKHFCLISTDKAVEPSTVMGASKRLAELAVGALVGSGQGGKTVYSGVRFGNVIGSSGSVIPIFERQIAEGGPVTVTDPAMTRFFMTIPEAAALVLQAAVFPGSESGLYSLDMGEPVRIDTMARDLIRLKGMEPGRDIQIVYTGAQPGEKIHEKIYSAVENIDPTPHPKIHRISPGLMVRDPEGFLRELDELFSAAGSMTVAALRNRLFALAAWDGSNAAEMTTAVAGGVSTGSV